MIAVAALRRFSWREQVGANRENECNGARRVIKG